MNKDRNIVWFVSRLSIAIFAYIILVFGILGATSLYREGDSLNYHLPIAKAYLDLSVYNPELIQGTPFLVFQPGINQGIVAGFMLLDIPLNLFNVLGLIVLFLACVYVAKRVGLEKSYSVVFAGSVTTLNVMLRWANTQIIDIWMLIWFLLILGFIQKIENNPKYFFVLGILSGLFIGSKYTGPIFLLILFLVYFNKIYKQINFKNILAFIIPFSIIGLSWYFRNYYYAGNPFYPEPFLFFKGDESFGILETPVWNTTFTRGLTGIKFFIDALISEFTLFSVAIFAPLLLFIRDIRKNAILRTLLVVGTLNLLFFAFLPSDRFYNIVVSVFRYSLPAFITLILALFVAGQRYKKESYLAIFTMTNFLFLSLIQYRPKLIIIMLPIIVFVFFTEEVKRFIRDTIPLKAKR